MDVLLGKVCQDLRLQGHGIARSQGLCDVDFARPEFTDVDRGNF